MKIKLLFIAILLYSCQSSTEEKTQDESTENVTAWIYPDSLDAVAIAPKSHEILLENENVRVLRVTINPGEKEPMHTHQWKSVMYVEKPSRIRYYNEKDEPVFESPEDQVFDGIPEPNWMGPEGLHAVENIDTVIFSALRVEIKN